jgi:hypothetical protein
MIDVLTSAADEIVRLRRRVERLQYERQTLEAVVTGRGRGLTR